MARPKVCVRAPVWPTDPSRAGTLRRAEGQQVSATALRPSTGSVKESSKPVSIGNSTAPVVQHPPRPQWPAGQVKTEQNCSPALGEKLSVETPLSATISSTFPGTKGLQATAPTVWPSTRPAKEEHGHGPEGEVPLSDVLQRLKRARPEKINRNRGPSPAPASISPTTAVKVEGVDAGTWSTKISRAKSQSASVSKTRKGERNASIVGKKPRAGRFQLSPEDLESDEHMRLKDKAVKLGVSITLLKNRRKAAGSGRWQGRQVRAQMKSKQAQAQAHA